MSLDDIKDYLAEFKNIPYETKRGLIILGVGTALFITPLVITHHYDKLTSQNQTMIKNRNTQVADIKKKATKELGYRKVQLKNQAQTQEHIEAQVQDIIQAQKVLLAYKRNDKKITHDQYNNAMVVMAKNLSSMSILGDPAEGLFVNIDRNQNLDVQVSYQPSYSVKDKSIDIVFHYMYKGKELYTILTKYDLQQEKIDSASYFTTNNAYFYETNGIKGTDKKSWLNRKKAWAENAAKQQEEAENQKAKIKAIEKEKAKKEAEKKKNKKNKSKKTNSKKTKKTSKKVKK